MSVDSITFELTCVAPLSKGNRIDLHSGPKITQINQLLEEHEAPMVQSELL